MKVIDSQVHIWKAETPERPWLPGFPPQLPEPFGIDALIAQMAMAQVQGVVIVPPEWEGHRNDYATEAHDRHPNRLRFMGRLDLKQPDARAQLPGWMEQRGCLGMRQSFLFAEERADLAAGRYDWLWQDAERYGIPIMLHASDMLPQLETIAERHPGLTLVIDHMGLSTRVVKTGRIAEAVRGTATLACFPNVCVKLSSAPLRSREPFPFRDMHDPIHRIIDAFGPQRCFWGTDLTHMLPVCSYREGLALFTEALGLSSETLDWIMGRALCERLGWSLD